MKLKKLLKHISFLQKVQIIDYCDGNEEILFEGYVCDVPWVHAELKLDTDDNGEAISILQLEGKQDPVLSIYVK